LFFSRDLITDYGFAKGVDTRFSEKFIAKGVRVTHSLASLIYELCKGMTVRAVSIFQWLHRDTVKAIAKGMLKEVQATRSLDGIVVLGADEIAGGKGHHYWTMISVLEGPKGPEMLQVVEGRREKGLIKFWRWFGRKRTKQYYPCRDRYAEALYS